jgi:hypothetical protein
MIRLSVWDLFFRVIPESFLIIATICIFANKKASKKLYIVSSLICSFITYGSKLLPISFGVNTLISMISFIVISVYLFKVTINISIFSVLISIITLSGCELLNVFILSRIFNINLEHEFINPYTKIISGLPSLFIFSVFVAIFYLLNKNKERLKNVFY